jgi:hypothetical protein
MRRVARAARASSVNASWSKTWPAQAVAKPSASARSNRARIPSIGVLAPTEM